MFENISVLPEKVFIFSYIFFKKVFMGFTKLDKFEYAVIYNLLKKQSRI
jgi:hypothetical protein